MDIQDIINSIVQTIIGGALSIASVYISIYVAKAIEVSKIKASLIKNEEAKAIINSTIDRVDDLIATNIISVENTLKPQILEAIKDGKVDNSELEELSIVVKKNVLKQMSEDTCEVLNATLSDVHGYIENRIERILAELKDAKGNVVTHTII